jgi:hypothetical protein
MSNDVHKVTVQIRAPRGNFHGEIAEGWYCVADGAVVLTDADGKPVGNVKHTLSPGEDARLVARRLVRQRRRGSSLVSGFNQKIAYPKLHY